MLKLPDMKDVIIEFNGKKIKSDSDLIAELNSYSAGDEVEIKLIRNGDEEKTVKLVLDEAEPSKKTDKNEEKGEKKSRENSSDDEEVEDDDDEKAPAEE